MPKTAVFRHSRDAVRSRPISGNAKLPPRAAAALRDATTAAERGDLRAAERALLVAHFHAPGNVAVLRMSGRVEHRQGRPRDAADSFARALAVAPDDAATLIQLAAAEADVFDYANALGHLNRAAELAADATTWLALGVEWARQGCSAEALAAANRVLALRPHDPVARLLRAQSAQALGDAAGAAAEYRVLIARHERVAQSWFGLLDGKATRVDATELAALERLAADETLPDPDRTMLAFALGRAYDGAGRHAEAFDAFVRANSLVRAQQPWDPLALAREVAAIRSAFAAPGATAPAETGSEVIFIVGLPRSGTTLIEQVLAAHPRVEGASELPYLEMVIDEESRRRGQPFPRWVAAATSDDWQRLGARYLQMSARWRMRRPIATDKLPENWRYAGAALAMLPGVRIVDCRRDAVETCWSCFTQLFAPGRAAYAYDFATLASYWRDYVALCGFWEQRFPARFRIQGYERFLAAPDYETRALLDFCGLEFDAACLRFHELQRSVRSASAAQVREPLRRDTARTGRYGALLAPLRELLAQSAAGTPSGIAPA